MDDFKEKLKEHLNNEFLQDTLDADSLPPHGHVNDQIEHSDLLSLGDDDHSQYHNDTRGDARYLYKENTDSFTPDGDYEPATKKYVDDNTYTWIFGDAYSTSDGDENIISGSFSAGPITNNQLTRDAHFDDLELSGGDLDCNGYRLFVSGTLTIQSGYKIHRNGNAGSNGGSGGTGDANNNDGGDGGSGGSALSNGTIKGGLAGATGGGGGDGGSNYEHGNDAGDGNNGVDIVKGLGEDSRTQTSVNGGDGGDLYSGSRSGGDGGSGGSSASKTGTVYMKPSGHALNAINLYDIDPDDGTTFFDTSPSSPGAGGGGGGSCDYNATGGGGGGGAGAGGTGGICLVVAKNIVNDGALEANGGAGGNGGDGGDGWSDDGDGAGGGGGAGGAGGNGGALILVYENYSGSGTKTASGGSGGTGGTGGDKDPSDASCWGGQNGDSSDNGYDGKVIELKLSYNV